MISIQYNTCHIFNVMLRTKVALSLFYTVQRMMIFYCLNRVLDKFASIKNGKMTPYRPFQSIVYIYTFHGINEGRCIRSPFWSIRVVEQIYIFVMLPLCIRACTFDSISHKCHSLICRIPLDGRRDCLWWPDVSRCELACPAPDGGNNWIWTD